MKIPSAGRAAARGRFMASVVLGCVLAGCVADGPQGKAPPRPIATQPGGLEASVLEVAAARYAGDSDKNGYADEISVTAFLFAPGRDIPITSSGTFEFELITLDGKPMGSWKFDPEAGRQAVEKLLPGPGYRFRFSLLAIGSDVLPTQDGQLACRFVPEQGGAISSRSPIRVTVGKIR